METTYDFSAFAAGNDGTSMSGTNSFGGGMGGFGGGMGGGTNSFGGGMSSEDLDSLFGQSPWGDLEAVGFTSFEQVFRGNIGGNLQRSDSGSTFGSSNNQGEGDPLLSGGTNTSANGYTYNFS